MSYAKKKKRQTSHYSFAKPFAELAMQHGLLTSVKNVPFDNSNSDNEGGWFVPIQYLSLTRLLVMDFELGHTFDSSPQKLPPLRIKSDINTTPATMTAAWL